MTKLAMSRLEDARRHEREVRPCPDCRGTIAQCGYCKHIFLRNELAACPCGRSSRAQCANWQCERWLEPDPRPRGRWNFLRRIGAWRYERAERVLREMRRESARRAVRPVPKVAARPVVKVVEQPAEPPRPRPDTRPDHNRETPHREREGVAISPPAPLPVAPSIPVQAREPEPWEPMRGSLPVVAPDPSDPPTERLPHLAQAWRLGVGSVAAPAPRPAPSPVADTPAMLALGHEPQPVTRTRRARHALPDDHPAAAVPPSPSPSPRARDRRAG